MTGIVERRARTERRNRDSGPPRGCNDRRLHAERRLPELKEAAISESEWKKLFGGYSQTPSTDTAMLDHAAEVFGRANEQLGTGKPV